MSAARDSGRSPVASSGARGDAGKGGADRQALPPAPDAARRRQLGLQPVSVGDCAESIGRAINEVGKDYEVRRDARLALIALMEEIERLRDSLAAQRAEIADLKKRLCYPSFARGDFDVNAYMEGTGPWAK